MKPQPTRPVGTRASESPVRAFAALALRLMVAVTLTLLLVACGGGEPADSPEQAEGAAAVEGPAPTETPATEEIRVANVGFATPESVLHDRQADVYLVSNINGAPGEKDGNGFVSRLSPEGEVLDLKWIDGEAEGVTLNAPKGMAIDDGLLYVADIDCVRLFDLETGAPSGEACPQGATFLNDLSPHPEAGVLLTDTGVDATFAPAGADALYHVLGTEVAPVIRDPDFGGPNGVTIFGGEVYVVTFMSGQVFRVTGPDERELVLSVEGGQLDGIDFLMDGRALVSNWATSCVHILGTDGSLECAFPDLEAPADLGVDDTRSRLMVPLFNANEVRILPVE